MTFSQHRYNVAGIYVHIPYCKQACSYCDFYFSTKIDSKSKFIEALLREINLRKGLINKTISTLYFGGGTPSLLSNDELSVIVNELKKNHVFEKHVEFTIEANPDDLTKEYCHSLLKIGVNRLSIGLQSFNNEELKIMNRAHNSQMNIEAVKIAQAAGFKNISVDLIYGSPWLNNEQWVSHLNRLDVLNVQHVSCYQLTVEKGTLLYHKMKKGEYSFPDDDNTANQFFTLIKFLKEKKFDHYEVSNFCKKDFISKHNSSYWKNVPYYGFGPSAHAFDGEKRYKNVANVYEYTRNIFANKIWYETELLTPAQKYNELILTGFRSVFGVDLRRIVLLLDQSFANYFQRKVQKYLENGEIQCENYIYKLSEKAFLFADKISADLFYI